MAEQVCKWCNTPMRLERGKWVAVGQQFSSACDHEPAVADEPDFGVEPYSPDEAITHACGILDVVKGEWGAAWTEHDQKVRAGLSRILTGNLLWAALQSREV